jgi:hypothetical protein
MDETKVQLPACRNGFNLNLIEQDADLVGEAVQVCVISHCHTTDFLEGEIHLFA